jgi:hypothetical protein
VLADEKRSGIGRRAPLHGTVAEVYRLPFDLQQDLLGCAAAGQRPGIARSVDTIFVESRATGAPNVALRSW